MDSRTLQQLADQAQQEVDVASRVVREAELQVRLARAELAAKNKTAIFKPKPSKLGIFLPSS